MAKKDESDLEEITEEESDEIEEDKLTDFLEGASIIEIAPDIKPLGSKPLESIEEISFSRKENEEDEKTNISYKVDSSEEEQKYTNPTTVPKQTISGISKFNLMQREEGVNFRAPEAEWFERDDKYRTVDNSYRTDKIHEEKTQKKKLPFER